MTRLKYKVIKNKLISNLVLDKTGDSLFQIVLEKSPRVKLEILNNEMIFYTEFCNNIEEAKRKARKKLEELGVNFRKEIRFKKHETKRKQLYQKTRSI